MSFAIHNFFENTAKVPLKLGASFLGYFIIDATFFAVYTLFKKEKKIQTYYKTNNQGNLLDKNNNKIYYLWWLPKSSKRQYINPTKKNILREKSAITRYYREHLNYNIEIIAPIIKSIIRITTFISLSAIFTILIAAAITFIFIQPNANFIGINYLSNKLNIPILKNLTLQYSIISFLALNLISNIISLFFEGAIDCSKLFYSITIYLKKIKDRNEPKSIISFSLTDVE